MKPTSPTQALRVSVNLYQAAVARLDKLNQQKADLTKEREELLASLDVGKPVPPRLMETEVLLTSAVPRRLEQMEADLARLEETVGGHCEELRLAVSREADRRQAAIFESLVAALKPIIPAGGDQLNNLIRLLVPQTAAFVSVATLQAVSTGQSLMAGDPLRWAKILLDACEKGEF